LQAFRDGQHLFGNLSTDPDFATPRISQAQPEQRPDKRPLICTAHLAGQLHGPLRGTLAFHRSEASRKQRRQQGDLEREFLLVGLRALGQVLSSWSPLVRWAIASGFAEPSFARSPARSQLSMAC
jgi:hypothetical protein